MLFFSTDKPNVVYVGVSNWGEAKCIQNVIPILYAFVKE